MTDYERFVEIVPEELKNKIPESRMHHALWNLSELIQKENPQLYAAAVNENASDEDRKKMTSFIEQKWKEVMEWHVKNGFVKDASHPEEIKREKVETDPAANKKILALVKKEYMKRIPFFVRGHATGKTCELIAREFPDLYGAFRKDPSADDEKKMSDLINGIFAERMAKHNM